MHCSPLHKYVHGSLSSSLARVARFPYQRLGDAELLQAVAQRDAEAVRIVWERSSPRVRAVLRAILGPAASEDLVARVFVQLVKLPGAGSKVDALQRELVRLASAGAIAELERQRRRLFRKRRLARSGVVSAPRLVQALYRCLDELPPRRRVALTLCEVQGYTLPEIASALRLDERAVLREIERGREALTRAPSAEPLLAFYLEDGERDSARRCTRDLWHLAYDFASAPASPEQQLLGREHALRALEAPDPVVTRRYSGRTRAAAWAALGFVISALVAATLLLRKPLTYQVDAPTANAGYVSATGEHPASVLFSDGSSVHASPGARLRIESVSADGANIAVERGSANIHVAAHAHASFRFGLGPFEARTSGVSFDASWDPAHETLELFVQEGSLELTYLAGSRFALRSDQHFRAAASDGTLRISNVKQPSLSALVRRGQFAEVLRLTQASGMEGCFETCSPSELRALADAARVLGEHAIAETSLLALRRRATDADELAAAAFLLGRISETRGQFATANAWYETSSREAPQGEFVGDALAGRMRVIAAGEGTLKAEALAREYLARYPAGVHAHAAGQIARVQ